jgi:hypothetical protein
MTGIVDDGIKPPILFECDLHETFQVIWLRD